MKYKIKTTQKLNLDGQVIIRDIYPITIENKTEMKAKDLITAIKEEILSFPSWTILEQKLLVNGSEPNATDKIKETDTLEFSVTQDDPGNKPNLDTKQQLNKLSK